MLPPPRPLTLPDVNLSGPPRAADSDGLTWMVVETCLSKALTDRLTARPLHTRHVTSHDSSSVLFHTSMDGLVGICEYKVQSIKRLEEEEGEEEEKQKLKG